MITWLVIVLALVLYFAIQVYALRDVGIGDLLSIEVEKDADGWHSVIIDRGDDRMLHVTDSYADISDAVKAAQVWIVDNG